MADNDAGVTTRALPIPSAHAGSVIGSEGRHIKNMIRISGVEAMWVDSNEQENFGKTWCHVRIKGTPRAQYTATLLVISTLTTMYE